MTTKNTDQPETPAKEKDLVGIVSTDLLAVADDERMTPAHYMAIRSDGLTFLACVEAAAGQLELVAQVDRLFGTNLMRRQAPIVNMIDDATGKTDEDKQTFLRFVWNYVFTRCAPISSANANVEASVPTAHSDTLEPQ